MVAETQAKRKRTAREVAEQFNISERTVRRLIAQPREKYLAEAKERGEDILKLRDEGFNWVQIGEIFNISRRAAYEAGVRAVKRREKEAQNQKADA